MAPDTPEPTRDHSERHAMAHASPRLDYMQQSPELFRKLVEFNMAIKKGGLVEEGIGDLIAIRASQINGCGFCLDMHLKQARIHGAQELRLHHLAIWRESPLFSERERAALDWTESLTRLPEHGVPEDVYQATRAEFGENGITELTYLVVTINAWNRVNVAFRSLPGSADKAFGLDKAKFA